MPEDARAEPSPTPKSRSRARALRNLPQERKLLPPPPLPRDATRRDETKRNETKRAAQLPHYTLSRSLPWRASRSLPHPRTLRSAFPAHPRLAPVVLLATTCLLFLSPPSVFVSRARPRASLRRERERSPPISRFTLSMCCFFLALAPARNGRLSHFLSHSYSTSSCPRSTPARLVNRVSLLFVLLWPSPSITLEKGHLLSPLCSHALRSGETTARLARPHDALVSRTSFFERTLLPSFPRPRVPLLKLMLRITRLSPESMYKKGR